MDKPIINLLSFARFGNEFPDMLSEAVQQEFDCSVRFREMHLDLSDFFDAGRKQYNGDNLLKAVSRLSCNESGKTLGLFSVDLYIPVMTYIFGQAQLGGKTGIASLYRLSSERYGIENDKYSAETRFIKEVIHELGHLSGLIHCHTPACVMRSGTYVEDVDQKEAHLCEKCRSILERQWNSIES
jgi:archaemetzincin